MHCTRPHYFMCANRWWYVYNKARTSIVYFTWVDARGGSRKCLNGCNRSSGMRARTTPTFSSETKALRVIGAWLLTNLAPLSPLSPPLIRDFLKRQVGSEVRGPQKFYLMKKLIAHLGLVQWSTQGPTLALDGPGPKRQRCCIAQQWLRRL